MSNTPMKPRILALLQFARQQEQQLVHGLSDTERNAIGTLHDWTAKDFLVNIMLWKQLQTQKLAMALRGEPLPVWRDMELVHRLDSEAFARHQHDSFQEALAEAEHVYDGFIAQVESMSEEELTSPDRWQEGEPLWHETLGNGLWHPCSQLVACYLKLDDKPSTFQLQESLLATVRQADLPPETLGGALYNCACFYAVSGWSEKAIVLLSEALRLRPSLIEWSKHDTDFDALRADPAYEAIYQDPTLLASAPASDLIAPRELYASRDGEQSPMIIDVRGPSEYAAGHIQGAINISMGQLSRKLKQIPRDQPVVTYCNMHHRGESRGERAAALLREQSYQARTIDGGYPAWKEAGLPVEEAS